MKNAYSAIDLVFKTPDVLDLVREHVDKEDREEAWRLISKWVKYGEYVKVRFDLDRGTATVLPAR